MDLPPSAERAVCKEHGLRYDPRSAAGCVLCRKQSLAPPGATAASVKGRSRVVVVLLAILGAATLLAVYGVVELVTLPPKHPATPAPVTRATYLSNDNLVSLTVPSTWRSETSVVGVGTLIVSSPLDFAAITVVDQARTDVGGTSSIGDYLKNVSAAYREPGTPLTFVDIDPPEHFKIDGKHGLRAAWSGIGANQNHVAGYLYVVQSATHFHQFLAMTDQSFFQSQKAEFDAIVSRAKLHAPGAAL
jgi:hypothetical protein